MKSFLQTELLQQKILIACTVKYFTRQEISPRIYFLGIFHASALLLPTDIIKDANYLYIYRLHALLIELKRRRSGIVSAVKITLSRKIHAYNSERVVKYPRLPLSMQCLNNLKEMQLNSPNRKVPLTEFGFMHFEKKSERQFLPNRKAERSDLNAIFKPHFY